MLTSPRILITAGPTHEPIDAVRYIANRSSGRMGIALAEASARRGWPTLLLLGPTPLHPTLSDNSCLRIRRFQTTADLQSLLEQSWPDHDVLIMAAAVADFRPKSETPAPQKITRSQAGLLLELEPTPDLLANLAALSRDDQTRIGFALEPSDRLLASAKEKLQRKNLSAVVANPVQTLDSPFITPTLFLRTGEKIEPGRDLPKADFAEWLLDRLPQIVEVEKAAHAPAHR